MRFMIAELKLDDVKYFIEFPYAQLHTEQSN